MAEIVHLHAHAPLSPPPQAPRRFRLVPLGFCLDAIFGGTRAQIGWLVVVLGFLLAYADVHNNAYVERYWFRHTLLTPGTIIAIDNTGARDGGGRNSPGYPIFSVSYTFQPAGGSLRSGVSYMTDYAAQPLAVGKQMPVTVEYRPDRPALSRIQGLRLHLYSADEAFLFCYLLIAGGLIWVLTRASEGLLAIALLAAGRAVKGRVTHIDDVPNPSDEALYHVRIAYTVAGRSYTLTVPTIDLKPAWETEAARFGTEETDETPVREDILYAPMCPGLATALAGIDLNLCLDVHGRLSGVNFPLLYLLTLLPIGAVSACLLYLHYLRIG